MAALAPTGADAPALRYLRPAEGRGPAAARNCGWHAARGALIAFTDDDTVPDRDWLAQWRTRYRSRLRRGVRPGRRAGAAGPSRRPTTS